MATTTVAPNANESAIPLTQENVDYHIYAYVTPEGTYVTDEKTKEPERVLAYPTQKDPELKKKVEEETKKGQAATPPYNFQEEAVQTVAKPKFGTLEAFSKYFDYDTDPEQAMYVLNAGVSAIFNARVPKALLDTDESGTLTFSFSETPYDPREILTKSPERRNLSPMDKAKREFAKLSAAGLSPADLIALLQQLQQSSTE